jgi:hypothetical protein
MSDAQSIVERPQNVPLATWQVRDDPDAPIILTSARPDLFVEAHAQPISVTLQEATVTADDTTALHPSLSHFRLPGRLIYIDAAGSLDSPSVRHQLIRAGILLHKESADARILYDNVEKILTSQEATGTPATRLKVMCDKSSQLSGIMRPVDRELVEPELALAELRLPVLEQLCRMFARSLQIKAETLADVVREYVEERRAAKELQATETQPWLDPVDGSTLLGEIIAQIGRCMVMTDQQLLAVALWVILTYCVDAVDTLPLLSIHSPEKRCGKTNLLRLVNMLVWRPLAAANITPAVIYRVVEHYHPTLIVDECDSWLSGNEPARGQINSGHTRDFSFVFRADREEGVRRWSTWCPKVLAGIGRLAGTMDDRSIGIALHRRSRTDKTIVRVSEIDRNLFARVRHQISRWATDNIGAISQSKPSLPDALHDRAQDNWRALLAIAELLEASGQPGPEMPPSY